MLVSFENVSKFFGEKLILKDITASISKGDKIGLVGINGAGKSTLINLLMKKYGYEEGSIVTASNLRIGYLEQDSGLSRSSRILDEMYLAFEEVLSAKKKAESLEQQMAKVDHASGEYRQIVAEYNKKMAIFEAHDGYNIEVRIKTILNGMGFGDKSYDTVIDTLSGGEKTRLAIAKLLLEEPDLLILDEPTNHLDFKTLSWLEGYLSGYKGALLLVSHDRYFLDKLVNRIWEIEDHKLLSFRGNYSQYREQKKALVERLVKEYEKQQEKVSSMLEYAQKNIVRASTSGSAKSRLHQLENMELMDKPKTFIKPPNFSFTFETGTVKDALTVIDLPLIAGQDNILCQSLSFEIKRGDRVAIVGANGTGKTTLLNTLLNPEERRGGQVLWGKHTKIGFYEQEGKHLNKNNTVLQEIRDCYPAMEEYDARSVLGRVSLRGENVFKKIGVLSGGERAKVGFAILMAKHANTLILDEPTNHIDLLTREALEDSLKVFEGTLLFVSHDRYFINALATHILEIEDKEVNLYKGNFDSFLAQKQLKNEMVQNSQKTVQKQQKSDQNKNYRNKKQRSEEVARKRKVAELEANISECEHKEKELAGDISNPDVARDYELLAEKCQQLEEIKSQKEILMEEWLILSEEE